MIRSACMLSLVLCITCIAGSMSTSHQSGEHDEIESLQKERVSLLEERVSTFKEIHSLGVISAAEMAQPTIDLIRVQIEYAKNNEQRRKLYDAWLKEHDLLIQLAEGMEKAPRVGFRSKGELLRLKAERIRIKLERASLD